MSSRGQKLLIACLAVAGTVPLLLFLTESLKPHKKPPNLPFANVATLTAGHSITVDTDSLRYFVVHPINGELHVVAAPVDQGTVMMPELHWWKPLMNCKDFGVDAAIGTITNDSRFRCRDADQPEAWVKQWQWDVHGQHIAVPDGQKIDNMHRVRFERDGDEIRFTSLYAD